MPIEIPEHLRYRAPVPRHNVGDVQSRYREPKQYIDPEFYYQAVRPSHNRPKPLHNFRDVAPRYDQPKPASRSPSTKPTIPKTASILMTEEYRRHKQYAAACGVNNVQSHWHEQQNMEHVVTRRMLVEQEKAHQRASQVKEGATFRSCVKAPGVSFGELMRGQEPATPRANSPTRKGAHSVVMNWVNNGVPIPGQEEMLTPTSPRRVRSPDKPVFVTGSHARPKVPQKYAAIREEKAVKTLCENMVCARTKSPPRVAYLPPKYQAPPSPPRQRPSSPTRPRSTANNVMSRSPARAASPVGADRMLATPGVGDVPLSRMNSGVGAPRMISVPQCTLAAPKDFSRQGSARPDGVARALSPTQQSRYAVGGGIPQLSSASLQRGSSPTRVSAASDGGFVSNWAAHSAHLDPYSSQIVGGNRGTSPLRQHDFLPFNSAPPPQLRGRV